MEGCKLQEEENGDGRSGASGGGIGDDENSGFEEVSMQRRASASDCAMGTKGRWATALASMRWKLRGRWAMAVDSGY